MSCDGVTPFNEAGLARLAFGHGYRLASEILNQVGSGFSAVLATADDANDVIHSIQRDLIAFQDMFALARLHQQVGRAPPHHVDAVIDEVLDGLHQPHFLGLAVHHGQEDHAEALLH